MFLEDMGKQELAELVARIKTLDEYEKMSDQDVVMDLLRHDEVIMGMVYSKGIYVVPRHLSELVNQIMCHVIERNPRRSALLEDITVYD